MLYNIGYFWVKSDKSSFTNFIGTTGQWNYHYAFLI